MATDDNRIHTPRWSEDDGGRSYLRALPVLADTGPAFDTDLLPADPVQLFVTWLQQAVEAGVADPHAMTVSTVDAQGTPRARVLILKAVDQTGWHFAINSVSQKGRNLAAHPAAALTFYWPTLVRQIRVVGSVVHDGARASADDFLARPLVSRAMALTLRQSQPLHDVAELDTEIHKAHVKLANDPDFVPVGWVSYAVRPNEIEFWQGSRDRRHWRTSYHRTGDQWEHARMWP